MSDVSEAGGEMGRDVSFEYEDDDEDGEAGGDGGPLQVGMPDGRL